VNAAAEEGEAGDANSVRLIATSLQMVRGGAEAVMVPLDEENRVGEVEAAAQGDPVMATTISTKSQIGGRPVRPRDQFSSSRRTSFRCTRNVRRLDTKCMHQDAAAPR